MFLMDKILFLQLCCSIFVYDFKKRENPAVYHHRKCWQFIITFNKQQAHNPTAYLKGPCQCFYMFQPINYKSPMFYIPADCFPKHTIHFQIDFPPSRQPLLSIHFNMKIHLERLETCSGQVIHHSEKCVAFTFLAKLLNCRFALQSKTQTVES